MKALVLDVDGVLVRGRPVDGRPWSTGLQADLGVCPEALHRAFFARHWDDVVLGHAALRDRLEPALAQIAPHADADALIAYWFSQDARLDETLLGDVARLRAAGVPVHLATNQEHRRAAYLMHTLGLRRHVDAMHYSAEMRCRKPEPVFFRTVQQRIGLPAESLVLIDDTPANVAAARALGWKAAVWQPDSRLPAVLASLAGV